MKNKKVNKFNGKMIITIMLLLIVVIGGTFAWFTYRGKKSALVLTIGDINDSNVVINPYEIREKMMPVNTYTSGVYSQVKATNNNSNMMVMSLYYKINQLDETLINNGLKYTIASSSTIDGTYDVVATGDFTNITQDNEVIVYETRINSRTTLYYRVYIWLDSSAGNQSNIQNSSLDVELNGTIGMDANKPILDEGMIPVVISNDGTVTTISEDDLDWYDYYKQEWANMVLVTESSRSTYLNTDGVSVNSSDILAYYVWLPRYRYRIWTTTKSASGKEQEIEIMFEHQDEPLAVGLLAGEYKTHPAFIWDFNDDGMISSTERLPGIWISKFEMTGAIDSPTVLPNTKSIASQTVSKQFSSSLKFSGGTFDTTTGDVSFVGSSEYGLSADTDSHMMKNSEWGAVAYLTNSKYGINSEVRSNNYYSSGTMTGCGAATHNAAQATTCGITYGQASEYPQSTTGNISGVFDMAGGLWEYVMGNYKATKASSGFSVFPKSKYYDNYTITSIDSCTIEICGGHSLFETHTWNEDNSTFISSSNTFFAHGADYNASVTKTGLFAYGSGTGAANADFGFRSVLVPPIYSYTVNFDATGGTFINNTYNVPGEYEYVVPSTGNYQLEVWGAQGGSYSNTIIGGYGGYSTGIITLSEGDKIYVNVGGQGSMATTKEAIAIPGGYNGGGQAYGNTNKYVGSGGGATHIATASGVLSKFATKIEKVLVVAGGGGGSAYQSSDYYGSGGAGGGNVGLQGFLKTSRSGGKGGTQTAGGTGKVAGTFGQGGIITADGNGGGGGYYGGGGGTTYNGGGGGSGYIGNGLLLDKYMYCYECTASTDATSLTYSTSDISSVPISNHVKKGDGSARISYSSTKNVMYNNNYGNLPEPTRDGYNFLGWYTSESGGTKVTSDTIMNLKQDHTLYARWE